MKEKAVFNWSGGKDSALALYKVLQDPKLDVISLLTTINADTQTSSIHAVPLKYIEQQAASIGIPLYTVPLSKKGKTYEDGMLMAVNHFKKLGVSHFIFGDIFLEEVRSYREKRLIPHGIQVIEPLWGKGSDQVMQEFLQSNIQTKVVVTQADKLNKDFIGRVIDESFINDLPSDVDICGENGEFHTFAFDGPIFQNPIDLKIDSTKRITYEFTLDNGEVKKSTFWQAVFE